MSHVLAIVPLTALPWSHCSGAWTVPSPHDGMGTYILQSVVHEPGWPLLTPSSQPSFASTALSPQ